MTRRTLALLVRSAANRVYRDQQFDLARAELLAAHQLVSDGAPPELEVRTIGRARFLDVTLDDDGPTAFSSLMHNLSFVECVFEVVGEAMRPLAGNVLEQFPDDVLSIQRYAGKTNELWTHLGVTLATCASGGDQAAIWTGKSAVRLLDPTAGRGSTLNRALLWGWDAAGIEPDRKAFHDHATFLKHWLREHRIKHRHHRHRLKPTGERLDVTISSGAQTAELDRTIELNSVNGEIADVRRWFSKGQFDVIFADLPYGVQHQGRGKGTKQPRSISDVARELTVGIASVARPGAGVAVSWNRNTLSREQLVLLLASSGIEVVDTGAGSFDHTVDRSVRRDLVVGRLT